MPAENGRPFGTIIEGTPKTRLAGRSLPIVMSMPTLETIRLGDRTAPGAVRDRDDRSPSQIAGPATAGRGNDDDSEDSKVLHNWKANSATLHRAALKHLVA